METERWQRIEWIYHAALDQERSRRADYVKQACAGDESLHVEVISLLAELDGDDSFLEAPAMQVAARALAFSAGPGEVPGVGPLPEFIGRYRVIRLLGEGGMGTVYEAEQEEPRRVVALKVIRPGLTSPERLRRFKRESQALGRLQHPGIAQIYESSAADTGFGPQPYFAMELIRGPSLEKYAEQQKLNARQKLALMAKVCDAVDHAHQRGLVHRDLKPGNILVDESGQPKILDFGVAHVTESERSSTLQTEVGQIVGTLAYMSPEQVLGDPNEVDARSDLYSLGVVLYELLSGRLPYNLKNRQFPEAAQVIREDDPTSLSSLSRNYRGDIETIVGKALEKTKARRYASAAELSADIQRYLSDEPILARRPSTGYQLQKFARRHRALVGGVAAVFLVLIAGATASTLLAFRAGRAEKAAIQQRDRAIQAEARTRTERDRAAAAEATASHARDVAVNAQQAALRQKNLALAETRRADDQAATAKAESNFLENDLLAQAGVMSQSRAGVKPDPDLKVRVALDRAATHIQGRFDKQPLVEASIRETIGNAYFEIGVYPEAQRQFERVIELRRRNEGDGNPDTLKSIRSMAALYATQGKLPQAEALDKQVLDAQRRLPGDHQHDIVETNVLLAGVFAAEGKYAQAEPLYIQALQIRRQTLGEENIGTLETAFRLGSMYRQHEEYAKAEPLLMQTLKTQQRVLGDDHPNTLLTSNELASLYWGQGKYSQADPLLTHSVDVQRRELGADNRQTLYAMNSLAYLYNLEGKLSQAETLYRQTLEAEQRVLGEEHTDTLTTMQNLAANYLEEGKYAEAEPLTIRTLEIRRRLLGEENRDTLASMNNLANIYLMESRYAQAQPLYLRVLEIRRRMLGEENRSTLISMNNLSELYKLLGNYAEADSLAAKGLEIRRRTLGPENRDTLVSMNGLGAIYRLQGRYAESEALLTKALEVRQRVLGDDHPDTLGNMSDLAELKRAQGKPAEAETLFTSVLNARRKDLGPASPDTLDVMTSLAELELEQKKYADSELLFREAIASYKKTAPESWQRYLGQSLLGAGLAAQGRYAEAEPLLLDGHQGVGLVAAQMPFEYRAEKDLSGQRIVQLYESWGKPDKAAAWREKLQAK